MPVDLEAAKAADIDILGKGRARMHADLAADDDAAIGLAHQLQRGAFGWILAHAGADRRGAAAEGQEMPGAGDHLAVAGGVGDLLGGDVALLDRGLHAERDHMPVTRGMGDVAGAQEGRGGEEAPHAREVVGALRHDIGPRDAFALGIGRADRDLLPGRVEMEVVPGDIFVDHRAGRRMRRHILDETLAHDPDPPPVAQRLPIFRPCPHALLPLSAIRPLCMTHRVQARKGIAASLAPGDLPLPSPPAEGWRGRIRRRCGQRVLSRR